MAATRLSKQTYHLSALILAKRPFGESDLLLELLTDELGHLSAVARSGRSSRKRFGGTLEPFHTLRLSLDKAANRDVANISDASLDTLRPRLVSNYEAMQAAGQALRWIREAKAPGAADPQLWSLALRLLDALNEQPGRAQLLQGEYGLELLAVLGWALDFENCIGCGKPCSARRAASMSTRRGGLVCRSCGVGDQNLVAEQRLRMRDAAFGQHPSLLPQDARIAVDLVSKVLAAHGAA